MREPQTKQRDTAQAQHSRRVARNNVVKLAETRAHAERLAEALKKLIRIVEKYQIVATGPDGETIVDGKYLLIVQDGHRALAAWEGAHQ